MDSVTFKLLSLSEILILRELAQSDRMNSYQSFRWCLYSMLRPIFKQIHLDIFKPKFQYTFGYFVFLSVLIAGILSFFYTAFNSEAFSVIPISPLAFSAAMLQVFEQYLPRILLRSFIFNQL